MNKFLLIVCAFVFVGCADLDNETSINEASEELRYTPPKMNIVARDYLEAVEEAIRSKDYDRANLLLTLVASGQSFYRNCPRVPKINASVRYEVDNIADFITVQDYRNALDSLLYLLNHSGYDYEFYTPAGACPKN
jgi:hypothetical protein